VPPNAGYAGPLLAPRLADPGVSINAHTAFLAVMD
jgi:hypothetical protein